MQPVLPFGRLGGALLVLAPHYDDEALGCGGLLAGLTAADKARVRVVFATDGRGAPGLRRPDSGTDGPDIGAVRAAESRAALAVLGISAGQASELDFPDGTLAAHRVELDAALQRLVEEGKPTHILAPFRFDRHPDHIALSRAALALPAVREGRVALLEYFVYYRFRLFPGRDIRRVVRPDLLRSRELPDLVFVKRRALDCFVTQTTRYCPWQQRPVLRDDLLREVSAGPELFLAAPAGAPDAAVLTWPVWAVRLVVTLEHRVKRAAYRGRQGCLAKRRTQHE